MISALHGVRTTNRGIAAPTQLCAHSSIISFANVAVWWARHSPLHLAAGSLEWMSELIRAIHFCVWAHGKRSCLVRVSRTNGRCNTAFVSEASCTCSSSLSRCEASMYTAGAKQTETEFQVSRGLSPKHLDRDLEKVGSITWVTRRGTARVSLSWTHLTFSVKQLSRHKQTMFQ